MEFSEETGIPSSSVQSMVRSNGEVDEEQLKDELKEEARQRSAYEIEHLGDVPKMGNVNYFFNSSFPLQFFNHS